MQIVIEISEEDYISIKRAVTHKDYPDMRIGRAILNGIKLPKYHGRLVDESICMKMSSDMYRETGYELLLYDVVNVPAVIPADNK